MHSRVGELQCRQSHHRGVVVPVSAGVESGPKLHRRAPLEQLPIELLDIVTADIDLEGYQALRLSSRHLHLLSLPAFTKRYFSRLTTTLGSPSLDRLLNISTRDHLAKSVTLLKITLLSDHDYEVLHAIARVGIFPPPKRFPRVYKVKPQYIREEAKLFDEILHHENPKHVVNPLALALGRFPNLNTVGFHIHQPRIRPQRPERNVSSNGALFHKRCFHIVLNAITKSGIKLKEFRMFNGKSLSSLVKGAALPYPAIELSPSVAAHLRNCFSTLDTLCLSVLTTHFGHEVPPGRLNQVSDFLSTAPNVQSLYLSLDYPDPYVPHKTDLMHSLSRSVRLNLLTNLHLYHCCCDEHELALFIEAHAHTLRRLTLSHIQIRKGKWSLLLSLLKSVTILNYLRLAMLWGSNAIIQFSDAVDRNGHSVILDVDKEKRKMEDMLGGVIDICSTHDDLRGGFSDDD